LSGRNGLGRRGLLDRLTQFIAYGLHHPARTCQALKFRLYALAVIRELGNDLREALFHDPSEAADER
jgi:hypothetical protein